MNLPASHMASMMDSSDSARRKFQINGAQSGFTKLGALTPPTNVIVSSTVGLRWPGMSSAWNIGTSTPVVQGGMSGFSGKLSPKLGDGGPQLTGLLASRRRDDSLTKLQSPSTASPNRSKNEAIAQAHRAVRFPSAQETVISSSLDRASPAYTPSLKQKFESPFSRTMDTHASTLSNASLLNGSAPDVEPREVDSFNSVRSGDRSFRGTDINVVDEFASERWKGSYTRRTQDPQAGCTRTSPPGVSNSLVATSQPFVPSGNARGQCRPAAQSTLKQYSSSNQAVVDGAGTFPGQETVYNAQAHLTNWQHPLAFNSRVCFGSADGPSDDHFLMHPAGHDMQPACADGHSCGFFSPNLAELAHAQSMAAHPLPAFNACGANDKGAGRRPLADSKGALYTPSYTPPTTAGSQRSTSESAASTRDSSLGIDPRVQSLDGMSLMSPTRIETQSMEHAQPSCDFSDHPVHPYPYGYGGQTTNHRSLRDHVPQHTRAMLDKAQNLQNASPLLREFQANHKTRRYDLKDVYHHIVEFSGDQHGSRFIQAKLETANSDEKEQVFAEVKADALQLMTDIFGNYVIQKMFDHGTQAQKKILANQMKGHILYLTNQVYGCRVVQKAFEHVLTDQQASMVRELDGHVLSIVENQNGNHVIQKAIERISSEHIQFIFDAHRGQIVRLSKHNYGCRVVQRMLEHGPVSVKRYILQELQGDIPQLIEDQYGNYVMQHIIHHGELADRRRVVATVQQQLLHFSKHKFASNVVEAAIESAEEPQRREILRMLTVSFGQHENSQLFGMIRDQYGNYVIQKVLATLEGHALDAFVHDIRGHLVNLRKVNNGKQVSAMEKALADATDVLRKSSRTGGNFPAVALMRPGGPPRYNTHRHQFHARFSPQAPTPLPQARVHGS